MSCLCAIIGQANLGNTAMAVNFSRTETKDGWADYQLLADYRLFDLNLQTKLNLYRVKDARAKPGTLVLDTARFIPGHLHTSIDRPNNKTTLY